MIKKIQIIFFLIMMIFVSPVYLAAAEILQIKNANTLLVGDNNRTYTIRISCLDFESENKESIYELIKNELPRHSRINIRPIGSEEGILLAKVFSIGSKTEISHIIEGKGLGHSSCS